MYFNWLLWFNHFQLKDYSATAFLRQIVLLALKLWRLGFMHNLNYRTKLAVLHFLWYGKLLFLVVKARPHCTTLLTLPAKHLLATCNRVYGREFPKSQSWEAVCWVQWHLTRTVLSAIRRVIKMELLFISCSMQSVNYTWEDVIKIRLFGCFVL